MKRKGLLLLTLLMSAAIVSPVYSEQTGAAFLKIGAGARPVGMASAFTAIANDASAIYWNPAGTAAMPRNEVMFMHANWLEGMTYRFASLVHPVQWGAMGIGVSHLFEGTFEGRDENRNPTSNFSAADLAVSLSSSKRTPWGSLGMNFKIINQSIESEKATGVAVDLGGQYQLSNSPLSFGLAVQNLGPQMKFIDEGFSLPLTISAGAGYHLGGALSLGLDIRHEVYSNNTNISIGTEYWIMNTVALRTGYLSKTATLIASKTGNGPSTIVDNNSGLGAGVGLKIFTYQFDYAFVPYGELGNTQRISLSASF